MKKLIFFALLIFAPHLKAQTCTAASTSSAAVQAAATSCGGTGTLIVPLGTATWTTPVTITATGPLNIVGATTCTGGCAAGSGGSGLAFADSTNITTGNTGGSLIISGCSATNLCTISDISFTNSAVAVHGAVQISGTHGQVSFRLHHVHFTDSTGTGGVMVFAINGYGLIDHYRTDNTAASGQTTPLSFGGDFPSGGLLNWQDATVFGSNQAIIVEDSLANCTNGCSSEGFFDAYYGAKLVIRDSIINGMEIGGGHGSDTAYWRSVVTAEFYNLTVTACPGSIAPSVLNSRGGTVLFHDNTVTGTCNGIDLQYLRFGAQNPNAAQWGTAGPGLNWSWTTANGPGLAPMTLNASDWQATHSYVSGAAIGPTSNNAGGFNYQNAGACTSSGTRPGTFNQTYNLTTSDGTCTWKNVGGTTAAGAGASGWLSTALDSTCTSGGTCTAFADNAGGTYPFRDQPGRVHNQALAPNYQWNNSGSGLASPLFVTDAATTSIIQSGTDFFNTTAMPGYTPYTYPDPLQGTTYYIGLNGGTATQSTGLCDVAYPGSGSGTCSRLNHPFWLLNQSTFAWLINASDTVQFRDIGPYCWGQPAGGLTNPPSCIFSWSFCAGQETLCRPPAPPNNVHILGFGTGACHDSGHTKVVNATQIIGINDDFFAFALNGTSGVDMECLDISGAETCTQVGAGFSTVTQTQQAGTTATYSFVYDNGTPLVLNENLSVSGTTNSSGHFNFKNQLITGGTGLNDGNIATITSYAISGSTATFQNTGQLQNLTAGEIFLISGFTGGSAFLNGQIITVLSAGLSHTQFEATVTGSGSATATGQINTAGTFTITLASATIAPQAESGLTEFGGECGGVGVSNNLQNGIIFNFGPGNQGPDNLTLADISIHGISHNGIWGSEINSSTGSTTNMSDIYLAGNGESDWDTDGGSCGAGCESQGTLNLNNIHAKWAGYVEVIPNGGTIGGNGYNYGVDQTYNGNGDCLVMIASAGTWNWSNSSVDHCGQDGFDFLHLIDDPSSGIILNETNLFSQFDEGQTIKAGGRTVNATNEVGTGSCNWPFDVSFPLNPAGWNALIGQTCRASDGMAFSMIDGVTLNLSNIDNITMQSTAWDFSPPFSGIDCTTTCSANLTNVVTMGFVGNPNNPGTLPGGIFTGSTVNPFTAGSISHTVWWQMKTGAIPSEPNITNSTYGDPKFTAEASINAMNIVPASGSPLIGAGTTYAGIPLKDIFGVNYSSPPPIGAAMQAGAGPIITHMMFGNSKKGGKVVSH